MVTLKSINRYKDDTIELPVLLMMCNAVSVISDTIKTRKIMINTISSPDVARYRGIERANVLRSIKRGREI